jgi:hypothetical protein
VIDPEWERERDATHSRLDNLHNMRRYRPRWLRCSN